MIRLETDNARLFVRSKGRLPIDQLELYAWLKEFAEIEIKTAEVWKQLAMDSIDLLPAPIRVIRRES